MGVLSSSHLISVLKLGYKPDSSVACHLTSSGSCDKLKLEVMHSLKFSNFFLSACPRTYTKCYLTRVELHVDLLLLLTRRKNAA